MKTSKQKTKLKKRSSQKKSIFEKMMNSGSPKAATTAETGKKVTFAEPQGKGVTTTTTPQTVRVRRKSITVPPHLRPLAHPSGNPTVQLTPTRDVDTSENSSESGTALATGDGDPANTGTVPTITTTTTTTPPSTPSVLTPSTKAQMAGGIPGFGGKAGGRGRMRFDLVKVPDRLTVRDLRGDQNLLKALGEMMGGSVHAEKVTLLADALFARGTADISTADFLATVESVGASYDNLEAGGERATIENTDDGRIAVQMYEMTRARSGLSGVVTASGLQSLTAPQARRLHEFLENNRSLKDYINRSRIKYAFGSQFAANYGGGVFLDGTIYMEPLDTESAETFLRLVVHETGHATFQRAVVPHDLWADRTIPESWDKGMVYELMAERRRLEDDSDPSTHADRIAEIGELLAKERFDDIWKGLGQDARKLYEAWGILRARNGEHLLGVDLGTGRNQAQRRDYQAKTFSEFCAESFMHVATREIQAHYQHITTDQSVPPEARRAWETAIKILDSHVRDSILGWDSMF
ncbi:MAG: hypothetical protein ACJ768_05255 [Gaiellaceae bacterium]